MSADGEPNQQQRNSYGGLNFGTRQQVQQGPYNIQRHSHIDILSKWFLIFSVVSLHSMRTVLNKHLLLSFNNISIAIYCSIIYKIVHELLPYWFCIQRCVVARSWYSSFPSQTLLRNDFYRQTFKCESIIPEKNIARNFNVRQFFVIEELKLSILYHLQ